MRAYHKYQIDFAVLLGADKTRAIKEMGEVLEFERALAHVREYLISEQNSV
jgi:hypothetical protein